MQNNKISNPFGWLFVDVDVDNKLLIRNPSTRITSQKVFTKAGNPRIIIIN